MRFNIPHFALAAVLLAPHSIQAQGTLVFDQQSSADETPFPAGGRVIQQYAPLGQSFTPMLSSVDFIRLKLYDNDSLNGIGAMLQVNLRTNSITGLILATSAAVTLPNGFAGVTNFLFPTGVPVVSGTTCVFELIVQAGDSWKVDLGPYNYAGGTTISEGIPISGSDLWFREGIVPEPSSALLALIGGVVVVWLRQRARRGG